MGYVGTTVSIPLGELALRTDAPITSLPPNAAIKANNVDMEQSRVVKTRGAAKFNSVALDSAVVAMADWFPTPTDQHMVVALANGKLSKANGAGSTGTFSTMQTLAGVPLDTDSMFVSGGSEVAGNVKKLFYFSGNNQIQVGDGNFSSMSAISNPNTDWASANFPAGGVIFGGRLVVFGSATALHTIYFSKTGDQEDFTDNDTISVFPGEGDGIIGASVYKGFLFLFKKPLGAYVVIPADGFDPGTATTFSVQKLSDAFGIASPHAALQLLDDLVMGNLTGSITSLQAVNAFGDVKTGDMLATYQVEEYIKTQFSNTGIQNMQAIYYSEKKRAMFTAMSAGGSIQDRILAIDVAREVPRFRIYTAFSPNCLSLRRDGDSIQRPCYGTTTGFVYLMDQEDRNVGGTAYVGEFQTPFIDFSALDQSLASKNKLFDFLEVQYLAEGEWPFYVDISVDGVFKETLTINQLVGATLDSFELDVDVLGGEPYTNFIRLPLHCSGRSISFKIYNNNMDEFFNVEKLVVSFRLSAEQQSVANISL